MKYDFIEIGCSDFETLIQGDCSNKNGVSIEPIKYYLDRLPSKENVKKLNWAISNYNGNIKVYYINEENMHKYNFPHWVRGCNSVNTYHKTVLNLVKQRNLPMDVFSVDEVQVHNFEYLYKFLDIKSIGFLKIDCEGHDPVIVNDLLDFCEKNISLLPSLIEFENNELSSKEDIEKIVSRLHALNYKKVEINRSGELQFRLEK